MPRIDIPFEKRFCVNCKNTTTFIRKHNNSPLWHIVNNEIWCSRCYNKEIIAKKWNKIYGNKYKIRRITFKDKRVYMTEDHRTGVCSICKRSKGDEYINYRGKSAVVKQIDKHHIKYNENDPLKDTIELCASCHGKISITTRNES
jgi:hypothetical protein